MILEKCFTDEFNSSRAGNNIERKFMKKLFMHFIY